MPVSEKESLVSLERNNASSASSAQDLSALEKSLQQKGKKKFFTSSLVAAVLLFAVFNLALSVIFGIDKPVKGAASDSNRDLWSGAGSIDITVNDFRALNQCPSVVLLGSSLIMHPFWSMDAELGDVGDIFHHHESLRLQYDLSKAGFVKPRVYSFAVFGEMISDAYIYVNDFLKGDRTPKLVVFGIAPRDFSDADLPSPTASFTFKRLVGLENFDRYASDYMPSFQERGDFFVSHSCFLYGKRWRLQHEVSRSTGKIFKRFGVACDTTNAETEKSERPGFMLGGTRTERFELSKKEYQRRYRDIGQKDLSLQVGFLDKILAKCQQRGIKVIVVNMPLTQTNRALLPESFYPSYRNLIAQTVEHHSSTTLIDLGDSAVFKDHDYWDTAHLNNLGGHKLLNCVEPAIFKALRSN